MKKRNLHGFGVKIVFFAVLVCGLALGYFGVYSYGKNTEDAEIIHIVLRRNSENCQDFQLVEKELNRYLSEKEDYQVQFKIIDMTVQQTDYIQNLKSPEPVDIISGSRKGIEEAAAMHLLEPLDSLLEEEGKGISDILNKDYLNTGYIDGIRYGLPTVRDYSSSPCFEYDVSLAEKYGLRMDDVNNLDDLEKILLQLQKADPSVIPVGINLNVGVATLLGIDPLENGYGSPLAVLQNQGQSSRVVNLFETREFAEFTERMYSWRKKGLLMEDTGASISAINYLKTHKVFGCFSNYHPGFDVEETRGSGTEIACVILGDSFISSSNADWLFWGIPAKSQEKNTAMRFLRRMYTDENVVRILSYGVEGVHYEYKDADRKTIGYPEGVNVDNSRYSQFLGWMYGNEMLMPVWEGLPEDLWQQISDYNDDSIHSIGIGFCFDSTPVDSEYTKCQTVVQKYYDGLITGELDPEKYLPILCGELKEAGVDAVVAEKQEQLNRYLKGEKEA